MDREPQRREMTDYPNLEQRLSAAIHLERRPVAVAFLQEPPAGVSQFAGTVPSGCSFWRLAAQGQTFYTIPGDHYNCPIGSYTHNIDLPAERAQELTQVLGIMGSIGYIRMEEIPGIYRVPRTPGVVVYSPLGETPVEPGAVIVSGRPGRLMLLARRHSGGRGIAIAASRPPHLHGDPRGHGAGHDRQLGVHRQSRLHRSRRGRALRSHPGARDLAKIVESRADHRRGQCAIGGVSPGPAADAGYGVNEQVLAPGARVRHPISSASAPFRAVSKSYSSVPAVVDVSLDVDRGQFVALVGRSGCGKSTLLNLAGAMDFPTSGEVELDGVVTSSLGETALTLLRREKVGFIFQSFQLLPALSVVENVELPLLLARRARARETALNRLGQVEMEAYAARLPSSFRAARCSASRLPAHWSIRPPCCWPMNRPAIWTALYG